MTGKRKKSINQSLAWHDTYRQNYRPAGFAPMEDRAKLDELKKTMSSKPKDKRLLTRYLTALESGRLEIELGKVKEELESSGLTDVQKAMDDERKKMILRILRVGR